MLPSLEQEISVERLHLSGPKHEVQKMKVIQATSLSNTEYNGTMEPRATHLFCLIEVLV